MQPEDRPITPGLSDKPEDPATKAQRHEVMVRALLLLSEVDLSRWQPLRGLEHALGALKHMSANADQLNVTLPDNDDTERFAISPLLWLMARMQVCMVVGSNSSWECCWGCSWWA